MAEGDSRAEEALYAGWITPSAALQLFHDRGWGWGTSVRAIGTRIRNGLIPTIAGQVVQQGEDRIDFILLKHSFWKEFWQPTDSHDFWKTGDITISVDHGYGNGNDVSFFGVRFDPGGIANLLPPVAIDHAPVADPVEPEDRSSKPALSDVMLARWAELFNETNPHASEAKARTAVEAMFPDKYVTRSRLRRVLPQRPQGRPLQNKDK